jgi:hypothetical protein
MLVTHNAGYVCTLLMLVTGCVTFDQRASFTDVSTAVEARSGKRVVWNLNTELDAQVDQQVRALLQDTLTVDGAIQVALLNNRTLQALYAELGVVQADLVQAGLLRNPVFDGVVHFPLAGGPVEMELHAVLEFLDIFYIPLRKRVAAARFEEAKLQVAGAVLDFATTVQAAFYRHQADEQMLELLQTIVQALTIAFEVAQRLHAAGNITDFALVRERVLREEAKLQLRSAEVAGRQSRITATDGEDIPLSAQWPETTVLVAVGQTRTIEFIADAPGDWAFHCHMTHHVMNQMGHEFPNMVGMQPGNLDEKVRPLLPSYMTMGHTGMDMGRMAEIMPMPSNSIPMKGAVGPFGDYIGMGGMFTVIKVRDRLASYDQDPGWYQHPPGTVARTGSAADLAREGIDVNAPTPRAANSILNASAPRRAR